MYVLDSDVLTTVSGARRSPAVSAWYDTLDETEIYISVVAILEKSKSAAIAAKRGDGKTAAKVEKSLAEMKALFADRILALDAEAADDLGRMLGKKNKHVKDSAVAAIARRHGYIVATGNVADYVGRGAVVINPYKIPPVVTRPTVT